MRMIARVVFMVVLFIPLILAGGVGGIWVLNTLFALGIPYTFQTVLASALLFGVVGGSAAAS